MLSRGRRDGFWVYLIAVLGVLVLLGYSGIGDWGIAHGQTAPGRQPGAPAVEATPSRTAGGSGGANVLGVAASKTMVDASSASLGRPAIPMTTVVGLVLVTAGVGLSLSGLWSKRRKG